MTIHQPYIMQPAVGDSDLTYTAQELRQYLTAMPVMSGQGVLNPNSMIVTQRGAGANFSVDVAQGIVCVKGDDITNQGNYYVWSDATVNVATPGAPGSGTRIHRLVLQVRDKLSNGAYTTYDAVLSVLQDTGSGTPAEPASALTLALITIHASDVSVTNGNIADQRLVWNDGVTAVQALQAGAGAWNATSTWTDFSGANWPALSFTVPKSGNVFVTVGAGLLVAVNTLALVGWRISGADTIANATNRAVGGGDTAGAALVRGSKRNLVTGLTPGATDTATAGWFTTGTGPTDFAEGNLIVEPA